MPQYKAEIQIYGTVFIEAPDARTAQQTIEKEYGSPFEKSAIELSQDVPSKCEGVFLSRKMTSHGAGPVQLLIPGNQHGYRCPKCGSSHHLAIRAHLWTALHEYGSNPNGKTPEDAHQWDESDDAACV
jgi:hypothetical protein